MQISVIVCTHNPHPSRLQRTLAALEAQALPSVQWETLLVDNDSSSALSADDLSAIVPGNLRVVREPRLGLTYARRRGLAETRAPLVVLVDDDNVLAPDYLARVAALFSAHPRLGAAGGRSLPEFEVEPPAWAREFFPLLALRDLGEQSLIATTLRPEGAALPEYPPAAPIGAGMAFRREAAQVWFARLENGQLPDRRADDLSSGGDNDIVFTVLAQGWHVAYFPELQLTHLISASRLTADYLARLNRGIQASWMQVLTRHRANPWPPIAPWTVPLRQARAWFTHRAWSSPAARIRWQGACGHFEGRTTRAAA